ncbi:FG-GAP-like repeat-containing protein [Mariniflexile sp. HMF6888]|uniref:FG-GAP-like repeat-containing protein n=1 Tax=Mariniflexile sp. HMF6888 TaxID=3373086 RepID=UPI0037977CEE
MKTKNILLKFIIAGLFSFLSFQKLKAQTFKRIESFAGLESVSKNNGVSVADYDNDGDLDLFVVAKSQDSKDDETSYSRLFKNNNDGTFTDVTEFSGLVNLFPIGESAISSVALAGFKFGAFWGDYDNDGYPDLFFTHSNKIQLFHNESNGTFVEKTDIAGFEKNNGCVNTDATWFDYNNDGFLDIYISDWNISNSGSSCKGNQLYRNNGDSTFTNVSDIFEGVVRKSSYQSMPFDFNNDGWMDLYVANDYGTEPNDLFINNNGNGFVEQANAYGLDHSKDDMGIAIGDYNNDGFFDFYITAITENALLENNKNNTFTNRSTELNVNNTGWAWGVNFSDFDLDTDEDLFVLNGYQFGGPFSTENIYFENLFADGDNKFVNSSVKTNLLANVISVSQVAFDYDNDGDLDIYVTNNNTGSFFYENQLLDFVKPSEDLHWLKVKLEGTISNRDAIGAKVSVKTTKGTFLRYNSGKGFLSQSLLPLHFGLSSDTNVLEIEIIWPSGIIENYKDLPSDTTIKLKENEGYSIDETPPSIKQYGCTDPNSCNYNPFAVVSTETCIYLEANNIIGALKAHKNSVEVYSYPIKEGNSLVWKVEGGTIIEQKTINSIDVEWGTGSTGKISLVESSDLCNSGLVELSVALLDNDVDIEKHSVARLWNEALLELIRKDYARPTVHSRNLFHTSIAMYDAWAIYDDNASTYLIGNDINGFSSKFNGFTTTESIEAARNQTISYAAYRLLSERFRQSPNQILSQSILDSLMDELGYDISIDGIDYANGDPKALGNYIANQIIGYGLQDGSNEANQYKNTYYEPVNEPLKLSQPESLLNINPDRWQPLSFNTFIDQSGNLIEGVTPGFLGPEWGNVYPFSLEESDKKTYSRSGHNYHVYYDPIPPPSIYFDQYKWSFSLVAKWSSHLDPADGVLWDISPKSIGNISSSLFPRNYDDYKNFYDEIDGGDIGTGRLINPYTKDLYQEQVVPRGDYTRVLAEFWADGPDSETPPGHWFTILNYVSDHELLEKKLNGEGDVLDNLEWDVKSYFILGGAMHDSAISAWSIKGWYDYVRPITAIRYMAEKGQSTETLRQNYNELGIPLEEGFVEVIELDDPLVGENNENLGKIKIKSWKGHSYVNDPKTDTAGVGWILSQDWWPYQRPTFVTPPFAGFVSGHSTFSRAAAEVMTLITGSEYFPGGMGEFLAKKDDFLVFEKGPSVDVKLQWATYRDASDQCSLSRIWGGIHPPIDDIQGRLIGEEIGKKAFFYGAKYFDGNKKFNDYNLNKAVAYPNPVSNNSNEIFITNTSKNDNISLFDINGRFLSIELEFNEATKISKIKLVKHISNGIYILRLNNQSIKIAVGHN